MVTKIEIRPKLNVRSCIFLSGIIAFLARLLLI